MWLLHLNNFYARDSRSSSSSSEKSEMLEKGSNIINNKRWLATFWWSSKLLETHKISFNLINRRHITMLTIQWKWHHKRLKKLSHKIKMWRTFTLSFFLHLKDTQQPPLLRLKKSKQFYELNFKSQHLEMNLRASKEWNNLACTNAITWAERRLRIFWCCFCSACLLI